MEMHEKIYKKIDGLITERKKQQISPSHITIKQLKDNMPEYNYAEIDDAIRNLEHSGYITTGRTINSNWVKLN